MEDFLPKDYKSPEGAYYKLKDGANTFRILSKAVTGYEYWNTENKPIRSKTPFTLPLVNPKLDNQGKVQAPKHFWAFVILAEGASTPQIMQLTQKSIQSSIKALVDNPKWGNPTGYDITIDRSGSNLTTEYSVMPNPHSECPTMDISGINLDALFEGGDPVADVEKETKSKK